MTETTKKLSLDAALRAWPEVEKSDTAWEELAQRIDAGLQSVRSGEIDGRVDDAQDEKFLAAPLGQIEGEGHNSAAPVKAGQTRAAKGEPMTMPADRERDRRSLQDLARMATSGLTPPPPSTASAQGALPKDSGVHRAVVEGKKDDSGIVDLAMAAQSDPQGAVRAQTTPLAKAGLFDDEPASVRPPPVSRTPAALAPASQPMSQPLQPAPSLPPPSALKVSAVAPAVAPAQPKKKGNAAVIALVFGGLVAAGSMAAGGFVYMKQQKAAAGSVALSTPAPVVTQAAPTEPQAAAAAPSLDPNALPTASPDSPDRPDSKAVAAKGPAKHAVAVANNDKPAPAVAEAKVTQKDLPTAPAGPADDLGKAMGAAVGLDGKPLPPTPASDNTGPQFAASVPQKPSQGAVTGALGAVLPGARACLGPDDPVSRASITFTSAGAVQNVSVTGGAAGKPAGECIKAALAKAKVAPFAEATYTANITVRH